MGYERSLRRYAKHIKHIELINRTEESITKQITEFMPLYLTQLILFNMPFSGKARQHNKNQLSGWNQWENEKLTDESIVDNIKYCQLVSLQKRRQKLLDHHTKHYNWSQKRFKI